jgi:hypothetical protein
MPHEPERTGDESSPEDGSDNPPPPNHHEHVQAIAALFGPSRPKDVVTGTANGVAMVFAGVVSGVGALITFPIIGAVQGGVVGMMVGAGAGVAASAALPVYGVVAGASQVVSGIINTPLSLSESVAWGRQWDEDAGTFILSLAHLHYFF